MFTQIFSFLCNVYYLFLAVLSLCCCPGFSPVAENGGGGRGSLIAVLGLLIVVAFLAAEQGL